MERNQKIEVSFTMYEAENLSMLVEEKIEEVKRYSGKSFDISPKKVLERINKKLREELDYYNEGN